MANQHAPKPYYDGYGRLSLPVSDFKSHVSGSNSDYKHNAASVTLTPGSQFPSANNVQLGFDALNSFIISQSSIGQGFITVGDNYDTWTNPQASNGIYFNTSVPSLDTLLNPIFTAINNGNISSIPAQYARIARGGIVIIKAGTYIVKDTISIPPGITLMGEGYGTKIVNATSINTTVNPPINTINPGKPVFRILSDNTRTNNDGAIAPGSSQVINDVFAFSRQTRIMNMVISDNFVEAPVSGNTNYRSPQNKASNFYMPLVAQNMGSNLYVENVSFLGRVTFTSGKVVASATRHAIGLDAVTYISTGSMLQVNSCTMDGFSQPIQYQCIGYNKDFLEVTNSKIRFHGYHDADGVNPQNNCAINANGCEIRVVNNHFWGNHANAGTILYIYNLDAPSADVQSKSKITVASNNMVIDKGGTSVAAFYPTYMGPLATTNKDNAYIQDYWNSYQYSSTVLINNPVTIKGNTFVNGAFEVQYLTKMGGAVQMRVFNVTSNYMVDSSAQDYIIFVNSSSAAITITLPAHTSGRQVVIKDIGGNAQGNNITVARNGGTGNIDGYSGSRTISTNYASWSLTSDGSNWWII